MTWLRWVRIILCIACKDQLAWIGPVQEPRHLIAVGEERRLGCRDRLTVAGRGGLKDRDRRVDVLLEERRQAVACLASVEGLDRVADVGLVLQQAGDGQLRIGDAADEVDDRPLGPLLFCRLTTTADWRRSVVSFLRGQLKPGERNAMTAARRYGNSYRSRRCESSA